MTILTQVCAENTVQEDSQTIVIGTYMSVSKVEGSLVGVRRDGTDAIIAQKFTGSRLWRLNDGTRVDRIWFILVAQGD